MPLVRAWTEWYDDEKHQISDRWPGWVAAGILEAVKGFRRLKGYADMPTLLNALRARDRQLGFVNAEGDRRVA